MTRKPIIYTVGDQVRVIRPAPPDLSAWESWEAVIIAVTATRLEVTRPGRSNVFVGFHQVTRIL